MSVYIKKGKAKTKWGLHPLLRQLVINHPTVQLIQANKFAKKHSAFLLVNLKSNFLEVYPLIRKSTTELHTEGSITVYNYQVPTEAGVLITLSGIEVMQLCRRHSDKYALFSSYDDVIRAFTLFNALRRKRNLPTAQNKITIDLTEQEALYIKNFLIPEGDVGLFTEITDKISSRLHAPKWEQVLKLPGMSNNIHKFHTT